jgi:hypothetical protein
MAKPRIRHPATAYIGRNPGGGMKRVTWGRVKLAPEVKETRPSRPRPGQAVAVAETAGSAGTAHRFGRVHPVSSHFRSLSGLFCELTREDVEKTRGS